ncbi:hypothetical protein KAFR_0B00770 [Kazachstania africana CBS 2517]|uniref:ER membrane protein complex subunit 2 n=1 Tax=Kazachstania africana (strain ATCC 22294 / BCRC 22015 / CBS 2517 / CECT 1963 / NBRC 1671 / NRRL Y-8276) TaxID=1071382 RepID=H2APS5_KAZAF|nr:hypothetical protein KAFR_0B00770 [Kazachstania africana CBS 2517]CCF56375.1 hypothetical protein KAFR_0B00770 [Kazachstania africana CBS 2517]
MSNDVVRDRFLAIMQSKLYTQFNAEETAKLHGELSVFLQYNEVSIKETDYLSLCEMLFYLCVYLSKDVDAQIIYNSLRDRLGENSAKLQVMNATLLQINENDTIASKYLEKLIRDSYEYDSDSRSYLIVAKKLLSLKIGKLSNENEILKELISLVEKFPLDAELWCYMGEIYWKMGQLSRSIYCFEEVLVIMPFNYVIFSRIAELYYYKARRLDKGKQKMEESLNKGLKNALRSGELSESYLKGWSLVATISKLLGDKKDVLNVATKRLVEISKISNEKDKITAEYILDQLSLKK